MVEGARLERVCRATYREFESLPVCHGNLHVNFFIHNYGALAQLGERFAGSEEVSGSIPLCSTKSLLFYKLFLKLALLIIFLC